MRRWQCPIHNGTLKRFGFKYELDIAVNKFKNWLFTIMGSLKKWMAHFYSRKTSDFNTFKLEKWHYLAHYWSGSINIIENSSEREYPVYDFQPSRMFNFQTVHWYLRALTTNIVLNSCFFYILQWQIIALSEDTNMNQSLVNKGLKI